jgi:hypothetical protein
VTALRGLRRILTGGIALVVLLTVVSTGGKGTSDLVPAADLSAFRPGNIVSNAVFYDSASMSAGQVQAFLADHGSGCRPTRGAPCLKDYAMDTLTVAADKYCAQYTGVAQESAAQIISKVGTACGINPRVLMVTLQKEMGLITSSGPTPKAYTRAMGYGCPDSAGGTCSSYYPGLFKQLYYAAKQFRRYQVNPGNYSYEAGMSNKILWHPSAACGSSMVSIENVATASLYNYTPYRPNPASLAAGYGTGDSCSAYGNRNFWNYYTDWFGSTQTGGHDPDAPIGRVDAVVGGPGSIAVKGWTYDPNAPTAALDVHVYVDGRLAGAVRTGASRPDVAAAYKGAGPHQGYTGSVQAEPGVHTACLYAVNVASGWTNPRLGCATVTVATEEAMNPRGALDGIQLSGSTVSASGWAFDPDMPATALSVHVYVDGKVAGAVTANGSRPDVGQAYPGAGDDHGFTWSGTLTPGAHTVCAYALNRGLGTQNPQLGCRSMTVMAPVTASGSSSPRGALDAVQVSGTTASARGWAFDPDAPTSPVRVHVYVDGKVVGAVSANGSRPDVGRAYPGIGDDHGFSWSGTLTPGAHTICTYALNQGAGGQNPQLGCRSMTVMAPVTASGSSSPRGALDAVQVSGTTASARGWAFDPDAPTSPVRVHVYVDGKVVGAVSANGSRPDVGRAYPGIGDNHGFSWSGTLKPGAHTICTYALNLGAGSLNPQLGCRSVTVG